MFNVGDIVFYSSTGVCEVISIGDPGVGLPTHVDYYTLQPLSKNHREMIYVPTDTKAFMRYALTSGRVQEYIETIKDIQPAYPESRNPKAIQDFYQSMMQTYDDEGRIIEDRDAVEGRRILWEYDEQGNVLRKTDMLESYEYASIETSEYENIYNKKGQLEEARIHTTVQTDLYGDCETQEYDDVIKYKYDARGRKISEESCYDSGLASTEIWRYDSQGRMTYREYHSGTWDITQTWTYDRYGNLLKTTRDGKVETQYTYVPLNQALWKK